MCALPAQTWSRPPQKQENPDILNNRHGQEVKASLIWRALNANTPHMLSGSDSQTRPVSEKQRGGRRSSQYLLHLKGPGQGLPWKWLCEFQERLNRWTGRRGSLREVEGSRQTARRSDNNSDVCLDGLLFSTGWYWVGINAPSRNHNTNESAWLQLVAFYNICVKISPHTLSHGAHMGGKGSNPATFVQLNVRMHDISGPKIQLCNHLLTLISFQTCLCSVECKRRYVENV